MSKIDHVEETNCILANDLDEKMIGGRKYRTTNPQCSWRIDTSRHSHWIWRIHPRGKCSSLLSCGRQPRQMEPVLFSAKVCCKRQRKWQNGGLYWPFHPIRSKGRAHRCICSAWSGWSQRRRITWASGTFDLHSNHKCWLTIRATNVSRQWKLQKGVTYMESNGNSIFQGIKGGVSVKHFKIANTSTCASPLHLFARSMIFKNTLTALFVKRINIKAIITFVCSF